MELAHMKRKTTKEILAESFRELAEGKSVDKITVQEIVNNCDYSTATFYRHFKDKYDLIAWDYARKTAAIMGRINGKDYVYDPAEHDGVAFEDLPDDWRCPRCRQPKEKFNKA